jgi:ATP-dependent Clp protease, protease subunit
MASLLLTAGEAGNRRSLPNSRVMLHQPSGGASASTTASDRSNFCCRLFNVAEDYVNIIQHASKTLVEPWPSICLQGQASDIAIHAQEIIKLRERLCRLYEQHTGQDMEVIGAHLLISLDYFVFPR